MKKINVEKNDEISLVVEKIIDAEAGEILLIIPRFSHLAESVSNFHLLKREADVLNKKILVESVDNRIIELSRLSGLEASNPFLVRNPKQFSDIVASPNKSSKIKPRVEEGVSSSENIPKKSKASISSDNKDKERVLSENEGFKKVKFYRKIFKGAGVMRFVIFAFIAGSVFFAAIKILPKAEITLISKKVEWTYNDSIVADKLVKADFANMTVPAQVFTQKKNFDLKFPATGKKQVSDKARGKIIIYNSYSSDPQPLVKDTRFMSPDGKIFRLAKSITVPGAKITEGKIVPSSIESGVVADQPGQDYNIGPVKQFTIPGFKNTPKYQAFYAESKDSMSGGFVGEIAYPTDGDIKAAKNSISQTLESGLKTAVYSQIPPEFKILDGASQFSVTSQTVNSQVDKDNNFSVFAEGQMTVVAFKEEDLKNILTQRALNEEGPDFGIVKNIELNYGLARTDFQNGKLSFLADVKILLGHNIDIASLKDKLLGQSEANMKKTILSTASLESVTVSLWPFWVKNVPANLNKIKVVID